MLTQPTTQQKNIFLSQMRPGAYQHRENFARDELENLAKTIKKHGVLNPPLVSADGEEYPLIAGERRWRALCAIHLQELGLMSWGRAMDLISAEDARQRLLAQRQHLAAVEVEVKVAPQQSNHRILSIIENGQRQNLTALEEARDYRGLMEQDGYSLAEVAELAGKSEKTVVSTVALLELAPEVQQLLETGELDKTQGVHLATVKDREAQIGLAQRAVKSGWKASTTEMACRAYNRPAQKKKAAKANGTSATAQPAAIPIASVTSVPLHRPGRRHHLSPDGANYILALSEECCGSCLAKGLSRQCLNCEGFVEFANRLLREVNYEQS